MLQPRPELPPDSKYFRASLVEETDTYEAELFDEFEKQFDQSEPALSRYEKRYIRWLRARRVLAKIGIAIAIPTAAYWIDVARNTLEESEAQPSIRIMAPPLDETIDDKAVIVFQGFNTYSADYFTKKIGPSIQAGIDGELWSVGYNNALLNRDAFSQNIIELAERRGIKSVSLIGYSAGGDVAEETATDLIVNSDLNVEVIGMISSPDGDKTVRPYQMNEMSVLREIAKWPGVTRSTYARILGETYFLRDRYTKGNPIENAVDFFDTLPFILERAMGDDATTVSFLYSQVSMLSGVDIEADVKRVAEQRGLKQMPTYLYLGTAEPGYDYVVDDKQSAKNICGYVGAVGLKCFTYFVPGAKHSLYDETIDEYTETFKQAKQAVQSNVALQKQLAILNREGIAGLDILRLGY